VDRATENRLVQRIFREPTFLDYGRDSGCRAVRRGETFSTLLALLQLSGTKKNGFDEDKPQLICFSTELLSDDSLLSASFYFSSLMDLIRSIYLELPTCSLELKEAYLRQ